MLALSPPQTILRLLVQPQRHIGQTPGTVVVGVTMLMNSLVGSECLSNLRSLRDTSQDHIGNAPPPIGHLQGHHVCAEHHSQLLYVDCLSQTSPVSPSYLCRKLLKVASDLRSREKFTLNYKSPQSTQLPTSLHCFLLIHGELD